ncbi:MAG: PHP domain-containing protein [Desulfomonile sp.]|nr:PHP domain-containing protein [Desulfomonile sp.]
MIDLHVHTTASDGTLSPTALVGLAAQKGVTALAITDHDTLEGVEEGIAAGAVKGVEVIAGVEMSARWKRGIFHILGYFIRTDCPALVAALERLKRAREERTHKILANLRDLEVHVSPEEVNAQASGGVTGRPHIARVLALKRYVSTMQEAFDRYLRSGRPAYVEKKKLEPVEILNLISEAGGLPVIAHPHTLVEDGLTALEVIIQDLLPHGLQGLEVYYPKHTPEQTERFLEYARRYDLVVTGGTDFHGANKPEVELGVIPGRAPISPVLVEKLKERHARLAGPGPAAATTDQPRGALP